MVVGYLTQWLYQYNHYLLNLEMLYIELESSYLLRVDLILGVMVDIIPINACSS